MDPFSSEGELLNIHNAFHQGQYSSVVSQSTSSLSPENQLRAKVYILRARIANGEAADVIGELGGADEPDLKAVKAFAEYTTGNTESAVAEIDALVAASSDNRTVQVLGATVLHLEGRSDDALGLLSKHEGNLEALALTVQIRLALNRTDLAVKEVQSAKKWAQDSLLVNLAESWVGLRIGGDKYQQSYYVYEELAQAPISSSPQTLVGQAVAELHLGRLEEAEVALQQALEKNPNHTEALANSIVLSVLAGKDFADYLKTLQTAAPSHIFLTDLEQKSELFDRAAAKYTARVGA
ncbi:coatomer epsilon subunit-domain-containing protein [Tricharina praecox]|uniref:coatomer epsilon subunit-domain-containing protein n=1 Tax=Tricharina praecox TaxID=43433 RepID=UPI002220C761|nr:coatomer epsilon subunit-domain-containing protein [Tricharina praecox]KAI5853994.1 coatomer epsilon subunit-domain-containing protein [Tricharina praecox]